MTSLPRYVSCSTALDDVRWRRSSHSTGANNCVEAAYPVGPESAGLIAVRDSTHVEGPALLFRAEAWRAFVAALSDGEFTGGARVEY
ncbi:DUF397 domain-containing protein [Streptomyces sp. NBC_01808]|uniref:DUF397 domain-containing protein n=1 Tax=Streptomyces sp. NBC_01808 TaxID=2975947 RepID=UPI002DD912B0|nr:DUF397 domain-containing protein [Streptomyces sp. NBC_01808]WSA36210.1 DUF397 domain-containing protein [Streptomyces sp. NBC_01808]